MTLAATRRPVLIDLTAHVPFAVLSCDRCGRASDLYQLIGTSVALCRDCFAREHG